ncbi:hypothetical protein CEUSTIGMA_g13405.t1 [Chlamydomonas eustigma]|uniref:Homeobox domain-containing protein n=1 Tax=Chlamydomonas eustigma TaxID=1157962 RepID=A0A250XSQ5_9CHLO|nr:hypothetical protein CEUSTIGMA_g13405.t1 [Chlamydomonas eustigma]|eukprot:GAX85989.1 hypothetical protein CEUSTIGMA_g13405.t1 [Chlamydomonas eustigma]
MESALTAEDLAAAVAAATSGSLTTEQFLAAVDPSDVQAAMVIEAAGRLSAGLQSGKTSELSPVVATVLEEVYKANPEALKSKEMRDQLGTETGLNTAQLQDWFYRRKLRELTGAELTSSLGLSMVDHIEVAVPKAPTGLEDAQQYIGRTVIKYFEPVPTLNYPGGNAAGTVADVQVQAVLPPPEVTSSSEQHRPDAQPQFLFLVKYGDSYEEHVLWEQLAPILMPIQTPPVFDPVLAAQVYASDQATASAMAEAANAMNAVQQHHHLLFGTSGGGCSSAEGTPGAGARPASRKPTVKRHRPYRYIQLPVGLAHPLFCDGPFPLQLQANMYVDNELVHEIPSASLIRCKHPRTQWGFQYQLYGVQDFRRNFAEKPLKVVNIVKGEQPLSVNVFFVNVVTDDGSWRATERDATQSTQYRPPLVPSAFIQRFFPETCFPLPVRLIVELNGELQEQIHNCSIHHDPKAKVYRLKDDKTLAAMYRTYELSIDSWKKLDDDLVQMCCRGGESQDLAAVPDLMMDIHQLQQLQQMQQLQNSASQQAISSQGLGRRRGRPRKNAEHVLMSLQHQQQGQQGQLGFGAGASALALMQQLHMPQAASMMGLVDQGMDFASLLASPEIMASLAAAAGLTTSPGGDPSRSGAVTGPGSAQAAAEAAAAALGAMLGAAGNDLASVHNAAAAMAELMDPHAAVAANAAAAAEAAANAAAVMAVRGSMPHGSVSTVLDLGDEEGGREEGGNAVDRDREAGCTEGAEGEDVQHAASATGAGIGGVLPGGGAAVGTVLPVSVSRKRNRTMEDASNGLLALVMAGSAADAAASAAATAAAASGLPGSSPTLASNGSLPTLQGASIERSGVGEGASEAVDAAETLQSTLAQLTGPGFGAQLAGSGFGAQLAAVVAAAAVADTHQLGAKLSEVMHIISPILASVPSNQDAAALFNHMNTLLGGVMVGQQNNKDSIWGLISSANECLRLISIQSLEPFQSEARKRTTDLLNDVAAVLISYSSQGESSS